MSTWRQKNDQASSSEDSEDEENDDVLYKGREAIIFVADAKLPQDDFQEALQIIRGAFLSGLLSNDKDLIGLVFANTEHSLEPKESNCLKNIIVPNNCAVFLPLRQLTRDIVNHFLNFSLTAKNDFINQFGVVSNGECDFANMIRLCCSLFQDSGFKLSNSTIAYFTSCTSPYQPGTQNFNKSIEKASDLEQQNIEFELVPMTDNFDYEPFYKEFLSLVRGIELEDFAEPNAEQIRTLIADRKLKQDFNKRCLANIRWTFGPDVEISVKIFNFFKKKVLPNKVKLLRKDNSIVTVKHVTVVRKIDSETNEITDERIMKPGDGFYELNVGGEPIKVSTETYNRIKVIHPPGMVVLCFKDKSFLPKNIFFKTCSFVYPDDSMISGSKQFFRVLWERCLLREKIIVCLLIPRRKSKPRYVALVPVSVLSDNMNPNNYLLPGDGFKVVHLPMKSNYRHINFVEWNKETAPADGINLFRNIVKKLRIKYNPSYIKDPALTSLEAKLLAIAFDIRTEGDGKIEMPDYNSQEARIASYVTEIPRIFGHDDEITSKRKALRTNDSEAKPSKIPKISDDDLRKSSFILQLISNNSLTSLTVKQLRIVLEEKGIHLPKIATKSVLVSKIIEEFQ